MTRSRWISPAPRACRSAASTCRRPIAAPIPASASRCVVAPEMPNNWASLAPFRMKIPEGCILNAPRPYPVSVRHVIGHLLPDLMMGCLHQAVPHRVAAEGASCAVEPAVARRRGGIRPGARQPAGGRRFRDHHFQLRRHRRAAGAGRAERDGVSVRRADDAGGGDGERGADRCSGGRSCAPDSGGAGRTRGGVGQIMEIATKGDLEFAVNATFDRVAQRAEGPRGRHGRRRRACVQLKSGASAADEGVSGDPRRRPADPGAARRRRHGRSDGA